MASRGDVLPDWISWAREHFDSIDPDEWIYTDYGRAVEMRKNGVIYGFASASSAVAGPREWQRPVRFE